MLNLKLSYKRLGQTSPQQERVGSSTRKFYEVDYPRHMEQDTFSRTITPDDFSEFKFDFEKSKPYLESIKGSLQGMLSLESYTPPKGKDPNFYHEMMKLRLKLIHWKRLPIKKSISPEEVFQRSLLEGPAFAEYLDKCSKYTFQENVAMDSIESYPEEYILPNYEGYDSIFRPRSLFPWKEDTQDFVYSLLPDVKEEDISFNIERELENFIKAFQINPLPFTALKAVNDITDSSSSLLKKMKGKSRRPPTNVEAFFNDQKQDAKGPMLVERSVINVYPSGTRDSVKLYHRDLRRIKRLTYFLSQIADKIPYSAMCLKGITAHNRLLRVLRPRNAIRIMLDIRKCGLTMPRTFMRVLARVLRRVYGSTHEEEIEILEELCDARLYLKDGRLFSPKRGYHLGMANEVPTIIQAFAFWLYKTNSPVGYMLDAIFFNDDSQIILDVNKIYKKKFSDLTIVERERVRLLAKSILHGMVKLQSALGLFMKPKGCFTSEYGVFCEEYQKPLKEDPILDFSKKSLQISVGVEILFAASIAHAKDLYATLQTELAGGINIPDDLLKDILKKWGYEFFGKEFNFPRTLGGWQNPTLTGVDRTFEIIDNDESHIIERTCQMLHSIERCSVKIKTKPNRIKILPNLNKGKTENRIRLETYHKPQSELTLDEKNTYQEALSEYMTFKSYIKTPEQIMDEVHKNAELWETLPSREYLPNEVT